MAERPLQCTHDLSHSAIQSIHFHCSDRVWSMLGFVLSSACGRRVARRNRHRLPSGLFCSGLLGFVSQPNAVGGSVIVGPAIEISTTQSYTLEVCAEPVAMAEFDPAEWPRFIELPGFSRAWAALGLGDGDLTALQALILEGPNRHPVVSGTGGLRKVRLRGRARAGASAVRIGPATPVIWTMVSSFSP